MVELEELDDAEEQQFVREYIQKHFDYTNSGRAKHVLDNWDELVDRFVKVMPIDYKRALAERAKEQSVTAT
jgi:glutamate synthase domain-containing protein 3